MMDGENRCARCGADGMYTTDGINGLRVSRDEWGLTIDHQGTKTHYCYDCYVAALKWLLANYDA